MRQTTLPEQTAKLIELGLPRPRYYCADKYFLTQVGFDIINYSIGELIEMLPETICTSHDDSCHYHLSIDTDTCEWRVRYMDDFDVTLCATYDDELINALYEMVSILKRRG